VIIELPDGRELDAPDGLSPAQVKAIAQKHMGPPRTGMGDVQAAPSSFAGTGNVPVSFQTGDPATDTQIAQNLAAQGNRKDITRSDVAHAGAIGAGLLTGEALPGMVGAGAAGALLGGGLSTAKDAAGVAGSAMVSGVASAVPVGILGWLAKRIGGHAAGKVAQAGERAATQGAVEAEAPVRSVEAAARERAANAYRQMERIEVALNNPETSAADRAALLAFKATPEYADLSSANVRGMLEAAPSALAEREAARAVAQEARAGLPEAITKRTEELLSPERAREQVMARVKRYGPPALGTATGSVFGGPVGAAVGSLAGAGTRPMTHALRRMADDPAVVTHYTWGRVAGLGEKAAPSPLASATAGQFGPDLRIVQQMAAAEDEPMSPGSTATAQGPPGRQDAGAIAATKARPQHSAVTTALRSNPQSLGPYAPALQSAAQQGPDGLAARHFVLWSTDEQYRNQPAFAEPER
jgi:hypothetical protein